MDELEPIDLAVIAEAEQIVSEINQQIEATTINYSEARKFSKIVALGGAALAVGGYVLKEVGLLDPADALEAVTGGATLAIGGLVWRAATAFSYKFRLGFIKRS